MNDQEATRWIKTRTGSEASNGLRGLLVAASRVGFGWFAAENHRWELGRYLSEDRWEEVIVWIHTTRSGVLGFTGAHHAIRTTDARTRSMNEAHAWLIPRPE